MANWAGVAASVSALVRPSSLQPRLSVPSIASLDWQQLKSRGGVTGIVIDKDNCIARPASDSLAPNADLQASWDSLLDVFGPSNVLVVSNSAGTLAKDPLLLQAESVSRNLGVPVLVHRSPKPGYPCVRQVAAHFLLPRSSSPTPVQLSLEASSPSSDASAPIGPTTPASALRGQVVFSPLARQRALSRPATTLSSSVSSSRPPRLLVIGDRLATDMILSHRLSRLPLPLTLPSAPSPSSPPSSRSRLSALLALFRRRRAQPLTLGREGMRIETVPVLTTHLWAREGLGTTLLRTLEKSVLWGLQRRRRRRAARIGGKKGTALEGVEGGRAVEDIEWEDFVGPAPGSAAPALPAVDAAGKEAGPLPGDPALLPSTSSSQSAPSPPSSSPPSPVTLLTRLRALPSTLPTLPARLGASFSAVPSRLSRSFRRSLRRLGMKAQQTIPRALARLHGPLKRVVEIYTNPAALASSSSPSTLSSSSSSSSALRRPTPPASALPDPLDASLSRLSATFSTHLSGPLRGFKALAEARAEEAERIRSGVAGLGARGLTRGLEWVGWKSRGKGVEAKAEEKK
ncbi:hypothetical protein JCM8097_007163 [Rhodosporidiobolus ruineniae]